jgi:2-methylisocitrate lyase-like PEP mutase family enzyme
MMDRKRKAERFRGLHVPGKPIVLFNAWDAGSAKAVVAGGAKAIGTSSWSVADANGFADGERIPLVLAIDNLRRIVRVTDLPVTVDLESGYGDTPEAVAESIRLAIDAGAVGCNLEDSFPANGNLRETAAQRERIRRARQTSDGAKIHFFLNVRTDLFFQQPTEQHDSAMVAEAIERARAYADAGADGLFRTRSGGHQPYYTARRSIPAAAQHHGWRLDTAFAGSSRARRRKGELWSPALPHGNEGGRRSSPRSRKAILRLSSNSHLPCQR